MKVEPIDITKFLPHRAPFLMVDFITFLNQECVETVFEILPTNIFVNDLGEFQESGLVENAAQTCATIVARGFFQLEDGQISEDVSVIGFISAIKTLKIHQLPKANQTLHTKAELISQFHTDAYNLCTMKCVTTVDNQVVLEGEINLFIQQQA